MIALSSLEEERVEDIMVKEKKMWRA